MKEKKQNTKNKKHERKENVVDEALQRISMNFTLYYNYYHWGYVDEAHTHSLTNTHSNLKHLIIL